MTSWVYIFSKFSAEALLLEALSISVVIITYAAFWILKKRRLGAVERDVPSSVVKVYLSELIQDAETMRAQLFGLLSGGAPLPRAHAAPASATPQPISTTTTVVVDPQLQVKLAALQAQLDQQNKALHGIVQEKEELLRQLAEARAAQANAAPAVGGGEVGELTEKLKTLEERLAEYSIIEDDLANLKRLHQENAALKRELEGKGGSPDAVISAAAKVAPAVVAAAPAAVPAPAPEPAAAAAPEPAAAAEPAPTPEPVAEPPAASASSNEQPIDFDSLVSEVEKSLETPAPAPEAAAAAPAPSPAAPPPEAAAPANKSDEDLLAEFEKMLNM